LFEDDSELDDREQQDDEQRQDDRELRQRLSLLVFDLQSLQLRLPFMVLLWKNRGALAARRGPHGDGQAVYGNSLAMLVIVEATVFPRPVKRRSRPGTSTTRTTAYSDIV